MPVYASQHHIAELLPDEVQHSALLQLLSNSLVLSHLAPLLSCQDLLTLAATSRAFRYLAYSTPHVWRRIDLSQVRSVQFDIDGIDHGGEIWRNVQVDENLTEDYFYSGPLRGIFSNLRRVDILRDVQVLILDGLSVTAELVHDILAEPSFAVRILSIRDVRNLNERKLCAALQYACRMSRPDGTPRLRGLYVFGPKDSAAPALPRSPSPAASPSPVTSIRGGAVGSIWDNRSQRALTAALDEEPEAWYARRGEQFHRRISAEWANTLVACTGNIAFDAVLCTGPRHLNSSAWGTVDINALNAAESSATPGVPPYALATHSLDGCAGCGAAPEGWTVWGEGSISPERHESVRRDSSSGASEIGPFPLLAPPPLHSANIRVAMCPAGQPINPRSRSLASSRAAKAHFIPRCLGCLRDRYCSACQRWWCETCYTGPMAGVSPSGLHTQDLDPITTAADADPHANIHNDGDDGAVGGGPGNQNHNARGPMYKARVSKSCWECGMNCRECIDYTQRMCRRCRACYCLIHNEGSNMIVGVPAEVDSIANSTKFGPNLRLSGWSHGRASAVAVKVFAIPFLLAPAFV